VSGEEATMYAFWDSKESPSCMWIRGDIVFVNHVVKVSTLKSRRVHFHEYFTKVLINNRELTIKLGLG
jgi:hypothetical protein